MDHPYNWLQDTDANAYKNLCEDIQELSDWTLSFPETFSGPIEFTHQDGSELSFVNAEHIGTLSIEYVPHNSVTTAIVLNRREYYHESYSPKNTLAAVKKCIQIMQKHNDKNYK